MSERVDEPFRPPQEREVQTEQLSKLDKIVLEAGLRRLYQKMEQIPAERFPQAVVFLDTSARPLAYAVKPVLEQVAADRKLPKPSFTFFKTFVVKSAPYDLEFRLRDKENIELTLKDESLFPDRRRWLQEDLKDTKEKIKKLEEEKRVYDLDKLHMAERAAEIVEATKAKNVLIVDDVIVEGRSLDAGIAAFAALPYSSRPQVESFVFHSTQSGSTKQADKYTALKEQTYTFGTSHQDLEDRYTFYPSRENFDGGFSWRIFQKESQRASFVPKEVKLGVVKKTNQGKYVEHYPEADQKQMLALRKALTDFSLDLLQKMKTEGI